MRRRRDRTRLGDRRRRNPRTRAATVVHPPRPIHRFRQTLQSVTAGQPVRLLKLRDGDFLEEMKDDFNAMLEALQRQGVPALKPTEANDKDEQRQPA